MKKTKKQKNCKINTSNSNNLTINITNILYIKNGQTNEIMLSIRGSDNNEKNNEKNDSHNNNYNNKNDEKTIFYNFVF